QYSLWRCSLLQLPYFINLKTHKKPDRYPLALLSNPAIAVFVIPISTIWLIELQRDAFQNSAFYIAIVIRII
ncbi:MAG: hypothetical protein KAV99_01760, partial [Candidatus Latescibacteria bacterium]|nr:hypothetical protein [Candidatus Latescibacterota bacterium]